MAASTSEGTGFGSSKTESGLRANGPCIVLAGRMQGSGDSLSSPPGQGVNTIIFPHVLPGGPEGYCVQLTPIGDIGSPYVAEFLEDDDGNFRGFTAICEDDGIVMYMVVEAGRRPIR